MKLISLPVFLLSAMIAIGQSSVHAIDSQNQGDLIYLDISELEHRVIYRAFRNGKWLPKRVLSTGGEIKFAPTIIQSKGKQGNHRLIAVWVEFVSPTDSRLVHRIYDSGKKEWLEEGYLNSAVGSVTAPTLARDQDGLVWLSWVGFDGEDDEIYIASLDAGKWSTPKKLYGLDNKVPDIHPRFALSPQSKSQKDQLVRKLLIQWDRFNQTKLDYETYQMAVSVDNVLAGNRLVSKYKPNPFSKLLRPRAPGWIDIPKDIDNLNSIGLTYSEASVATQLPVNFR